MPDETHLSEFFCEEVATISARLQNEFTGNEYGSFYDYCMQLELEQATTHLETTWKKWSTYLQWLDTEGKAKHPEQFDADFIDWMKAKHKEVGYIVGQWFVLIAKNGGSEQVARLVKQTGIKLKIAPPTPFAPLDTENS